MDEIWVDVKGYEGYYQVSNKGRVRSLDRIVIGRHGKPVAVPGCILKGEMCKGYRRVNLAKDGKVKHMQVHRLVALNFLPNPDDLPIINHKDENRTNNQLGNLEWCTYEYNNTYGSCLTRKGASRSRSVRSIDPETGLTVKEYPSFKEAAKDVGGSHTNISTCCKKRRWKAYGYYWAYIPKERK